MDFNDLINSNLLNLIGRTYIENDILYMNFSGSGISFKVEGKEVYLKFTASNYSLENSCPYISILVDENRYDYRLDKENNDIHLVFEEGIHIIKVLKRTESSVSFVGVKEINANIIYWDKKERLKIEFYGDSITCGYGVLGTNPNEPFKTATESFLDSYAYLSCELLKADYSAICVSGFPIYKSRWNEGFPVESIADMISFCDYREDMSFSSYHKWNNDLFIPDIVVVNLGSNDCSYFTEGQNWVDDLVLRLGSFKKALESDVFKEKLKKLELKIIDFIDVLFKVYPNVKIIWALGILEVNDHIQEVIDRVMNSYNNPNLYQLNFTTLTRVNERGSNWHPGKRMQLDGAMELTNFIKEKVLGDKNV